MVNARRGFTAGALLMVTSLVPLVASAQSATHLNVPVSEFVQLRWQVVADVYGGYMIRDQPPSAPVSHWKVPAGKAFVLTDYSCHLYNGTGGQTEAVEVKRYNTSLDEPFHSTAVVLGPDGGAGISTHLTAGVVVPSGTELMFRQVGTAGGIPTLNNWAMIEGYLVDVPQRTLPGPRGPFNPGSLGPHPRRSTGPAHRAGAGAAVRSADRIEMLRSPGGYFQSGAPRPPKNGGSR